MEGYDDLIRKPELHLSTYYPTPAIGVESCTGCGVKDYQANPPLKVCSGCKYWWYCSSACSKKDWKAHKPNCEAYSRRMRLNETQALSNPRDALLTSKVIKFINQIGANEILFAAHLGPLHLSHPSLPRIDHSHVLILQIEVDPDASDRPLREQYQIFNWGLETVKQVVSAKTPTGKQKTSSDDAWKLTHRRPMMKDENGCVDYEYNIIFTGFWKEASEERRTISFVRSYGAWIQVNKPGTEREYDAICDGWFEFLQQSMLGPAQQFRHLFDRKVDLATRSFDFGKLEEGRLPSRDSPGYQAAREAMFRREEEFRNMMRQVLSVQPRGLDGGMLSGMLGPGVATMMDGSTVATFHDGTSIATLKVENGQDLLEPGRNERKKAKKDERKRQKEARAEAERFIELVPDDLD